MGWSSHETLGVKVKMSVPFFCGTDISFFLILYSKGLFVVFALFSLKTNFFLLRKKASSACYTFAPEMMMEVWLRGIKRHTANVLNRKVPEVRILLLPQIGEVAQLD